MLIFIVRANLGKTPEFEVDKHLNQGNRLEELQSKWNEFHYKI